MKTLYMFTRSPWSRRDMENWLQRVDAEDGVLLVQDAVLAMRSAPAPIKSALENIGARAFALRADLKARGIDVHSPHSVVDDLGAINLFKQYSRIVSF